MARHCFQENSDPWHNGCVPELDSGKRMARIVTCKMCVAPDLAARSMLIVVRQAVSAG